MNSMNFIICFKPKLKPQSCKYVCVYFWVLVWSMGNIIYIINYHIARPSNCFLKACSQTDRSCHLSTHLSKCILAAPFCSLFISLYFMYILLIYRTQSEIMDCVLEWVPCDERTKWDSLTPRECCTLAEQSIFGYFKSALKLGCFFRERKKHLLSHEPNTLDSTIFCGIHQRFNIFNALFQCSRLKCDIAQQLIFIKSYYNQWHLCIGGQDPLEGAHIKIFFPAN